MNKRLIFILILLMLPVNQGFADDSLEEWAIERRCVGDATLPPDDWSFDGTIITTGWAGIHGIRSDWDTPHVLAFRDGWIIEGGQGTLSPDGRWYVIPEGSFRYKWLYAGDMIISRLLIYDLTGEKGVLRIEWNDTYELRSGSGSTASFTSRTPVWFDANTIIYQRGETYYFIHVPDLKIETWFDASAWANVSPVWVFASHPSPDWEQIVVHDSLFNAKSAEFVAYLYDRLGNSDLPSVAWHPYSTEFILAAGLSTAIYDRNGQVVDLISTGAENGGTFIGSNRIRISENAYSPDGRLLWFEFYPGNGSYLAIANRTERRIINTCIPLDYTNAYFSPDSRYIAVFSQGDEQPELQIFDIENWKLYKTGIYHRGQILGWRVD